MDFNGYRSDGVAAAVALVNAVDDAAAADQEDRPDHDELRELLRAQRFRVADFAPSEAPVLRSWAAALRPVFEAGEVTVAAERINALLRDIDVRPHLIDHGHGIHLHFAPQQARLVDRVRTNTVMGLATLVNVHGSDRLGVCAADGCRRVFADTSRNGKRRYCSETCANRSNVAAHRARRRAAG